MKKSPHKRQKDSPEGRIQLSIIHYCKLKGFVIGKTKTMGIRDKGFYRKAPYIFTGKCDLEAFAPNGIMYGIEVKSKTGKLSEHQKAYRDIFHKPPDRIFIEAHSLDDVIKVVG